MTFRVSVLNVAAVYVLQDFSSGITQTELPDEGESGNFILLYALNNYGFDGMINFEGPAAGRTELQLLK